MRRLILTLWAAAGLAAAPVFGGERSSLDAGWAFHLGDVAGAEAPGFADGAWRRVDVPHDWSIESAPEASAPGAGAIGFLPSGIGWYRRTLDLPAPPAGGRIEAVFDGVYMNAEVWINGHSVGRHPYGYTPFRCDLTPWARAGADNVLAVRVDNSAEPNSRWYSGSGIYRHVWLEIAGATRIAPSGLFLRTLSASPERAVVRAEIEVENDAAEPRGVGAEIALLDSAGRTAASAEAKGTVAAQGRATLSAEFPVDRPALWSPDSPSLYRAEVRLLPPAGDHELDRLSVAFGIRTVAVSAARGLELNGRPLKLAGGSVHHDDGVLGAAAYDRAEERRVELLKAAGFNAVRTAHNPPSPAFLDACDRLGVAVLDEIFDGWKKPKNPHDYSVYFDDWWRRDVDSWIRRDRNHPSVVFWSVGNEVFERGEPSGARIGRLLAARVRELDPGRPVAAGLNNLGANGDWTRIDPLFAALDVAGYNYEIARAEADHVRLPERVIVNTESYPTAAFRNWAGVRDHPYVVGDFVWSAMDYLGESGLGKVFPPGQPVVDPWKGNLWPWHGAASGDIDLTGWRRPGSHYRNIVWDRGEKLYAAVTLPAPGGGEWNLSRWAQTPALPSWTWPGQEGKPLSVQVYSRYEAVRLYLDGRLLGEKPTGREQEFKAVFAVPYAPGTLRAAGVEAGRETAEFTLRTAGPAVGLRLSPDRAALRADGEDLSFITLEAVDRDGQWVPDASSEVRLAVDGPGEIAGLGTADLTSPACYQASSVRLFQGRALLVVRSGRRAGSIAVKAESTGLAPGSASLTALF